MVLRGTDTSSRDQEPKTDEQAGPHAAFAFAFTLNKHYATPEPLRHKVLPLFIVRALEVPVILIVTLNDLSLSSFSRWRSKKPVPGSICLHCKHGTDRPSRPGISELNCSLPATACNYSHILSRVHCSVEVTVYRFGHQPVCIATRQSQARSSLAAVTLIGERG